MLCEVAKEGVCVRLLQLQKVTEQLAGQEARTREWKWQELRPSGKHGVKRLFLPSGNVAMA